MATATDGRGLRPMSVPRLRRLMTAPTVEHYHGGRARVWIAFWNLDRETEARARQDDWSNPAYTDGDAS